MGTNKLSKAVADLRDRLGETQRAFADRVGVGVRSVIRYEGGQAPDDVPLSQLAVIAEEAGHQDLAAIFSKALDKRFARFDVDAATALRSHLETSFDFGRTGTKELLIQVLETALEIARRLPDEPQEPSGTADEHKQKMLAAIFKEAPRMPLEMAEALTHSIPFGIGGVASYGQADDTNFSVRLEESLREHYGEEQADPRKNVSVRS